MVESIDACVSFWRSRRTPSELRFLASRMAFPAKGIRGMTLQLSCVSKRTQMQLLRLQMTVIEITLPMKTSLVLVP